MKKRPTKTLPRTKHEQELDRTDQAGPQSVAHADLVPPLRMDPDFLFSYGTLLPYARANMETLWASAEIPLAREDGRAPHRRESLMGRVATVVVRGGIIVIGPEAAETRNGTFADLIVAKSGRVSEHALVHAQSGERVILESRSDAMERLAPVILAGGHLPAGWAWNPRPDLLEARWAPVPLGKRTSGPATIVWRGQSGRWLIQEWVDQVTVQINGKRICEAAGDVRVFADVRAANRLRKNPVLGCGRPERSIYRSCRTA